tara:strand:+ start:291 stop:776 length:486 start_codon:yes stop_codon:yes gene_type:complete
MKIKVSILFICFLVTFGCNDTPKKESKPTTPEVVEKKAKELNLILNSNDQMQFDKKVLSASPGQKVTLTLNHTGRGNKMIMGHNFVLLKSGIDVDDFARRAVEAIDSEYIPEGDEMIAYTTLIGGGETTSVTFEAPSTGIYTFICTFPAHYQLMKGQLIVK